MITILKISTMTAFGSHVGFINTQRESTDFLTAANLGLHGWQAHKMMW